jgi:hypothetical protein
VSQALARTREIESVMGKRSHSRRIHRRARREKLACSNLPGSRTTEEEKCGDQDGGRMLEKTTVVAIFRTIPVAVPAAVRPSYVHLGRRFRIRLHGKTRRGRFLPPSIIVLRYRNPQRNGPSVVRQESV